MANALRLTVLVSCLLAAGFCSNNVHNTESREVAGSQVLDLSAHGLAEGNDLADTNGEDDSLSRHPIRPHPTHKPTPHPVTPTPTPHPHPAPRPHSPIAPPIKSKGAKTFLWITFILMLASAIGFSFLGASKPMHLRSHAFVSTGIVTFAAAAYFAIASNKGYTDVSIHPHTYLTRGVFYARYIDWMFTTPLLLLDILLLAGTDFGTTLWIVFCDVAMISLGLAGSVISDSSKWGWFGFACAFQLLVTYGLLGSALQAVQKRSDALYKYYVGFAIYLSILWLGYPIVWGLSEGSNTISSDAEAVLYAILDILAKVVFGWAIILSTSGFQKEILEVEKREGVDDTINALTTPINLVWGTSGSAARYHQTAGDATDAGEGGTTDA